MELVLAAPRTDGASVMDNLLEPGTKILTHLKGEDKIATVVNVQPAGVEVAFDSGDRTTTTIHELLEHLGSQQDCPVCSLKYWDRWEDFNSF
jgi:hypothetical protein